MAKQGLNKIWIFKDQIGLIWGEQDGRSREERRGEEEEEEEKMEEPRSRPKRYGCLDFGMETTFSRDFVWITWNLRLDMVNLLSINLGF